jgi:hypothetical protein
MPPDSGLSTRRRPRPAASAASARVASGSIEDMSMIRVPGAAPSATPAGPKTAARTIAAVFSDRITAPAPAAAAADVGAATAPCPTSAATRAGSRSNTARAEPVSSSRAPMAPPIAPAPIRARGMVMRRLRG